MKNKILKIVLRIIFGEYALLGFYDEKADKEAVGVQVKKVTADRYAYLHQEDRELDNAIFTMKKILKESGLRESGLRPNN